MRSINAHYCQHHEFDPIWLFIDFEWFWAQIAIIVLLDCLNLVNTCHPCYFRRDTLFDLRRTTIMTAVHDL